MLDATIIPLQSPLPQVLPTIEGNVDYRNLREQFQRIDELLRQSGLEREFIQSDLEQWSHGQKRVTARAQHTRQIHCQRALRCNLARVLLHEDYRGFASRLADSPLLQHFCRLSQLTVRIPSKSTLQRYDQWWEESQVRERIEQFLRLGAQEPGRLDLDQALDLNCCFLDTTCVEANIHYPVDWVLLRDGTRTLMKAVSLIRGQGLKHRMEEPEVFISRVNKLCIQMTHAWNQVDGQKQRKRTLRKMDRVVGTVRRHAQRYRDLLGEQWEQTQWTRAQADQVLGRMDQVLQQWPEARRQARERILAGRQVDNADKILSLYEPDVHVIVRKKAGAPVEFGNTLLLGENPQGVILDWALFKDSAPADSQLLPGSVGRMEKIYGPLKAVGADRGFDNSVNREGLAGDGIYNGVCPRSPKALKARMRSPKFRKLQRRRAQTEARIGIIKNVFLRGRPRCKGFANRKLTLTWTVLVHNLWVIARRPRKAAAQAAAA
jgi:hypothetical protein